jgi:dynein heavy chain
LKILYEATGDLLNNEVLIETLEKSKVEGKEIEERLKKQELERELFN